MYFVYNYRTLKDWQNKRGQLVLETEDKEKAIITAMEYTFGGREHSMVTDGIDFKREY